MTHEKSILLYLCASLAHCQGCVGDVYLEELGPAFAPLDAETEVVRQEVWAAVGALRHVTVPEIDVEIRALSYADFRTSSRYIVCGATDPEPCPGVQARAWVWTAESQNGGGRLAQITLPTDESSLIQRKLLIHELVHAALFAAGLDMDHKHIDASLWALESDI